MLNDLKIIKKLYGEKMMHLCRELFPTILEQERLLSNLLLTHLEPSRFLYDDIIRNELEVDFKAYIYNLINPKKDKKVKTNKTPDELLSEVGYILYKCETENDIQNFKKYYSENEELCSFKKERTNDYHVFFAIKKNVDEIKRENFKVPRRQDEYGTSVISIQILKGDVNTLSIKNRYNHIVNNPDATFSNNLENIIPGLTDSFEKKYNLNINQNDNGKFELSEYVLANNGKYYKYNYEINNVYYCPNNIIIDNFEVKKYESEKYIILDYFILDLQNKTLKLYDKEIQDSFIDGINDIEKISVIRLENEKQIEIITKEKNKIKIILDKTNEIIGYKNEQITEIKDSFLYYNEVLQKLDLPNLEKVGDKFLYNNEALIEINLLKLEKIGSYFLNFNRDLSKLNLPNLIEIGGFFLDHNIELSELELEKVKIVDFVFLARNTKITRLCMPKLIKTGHSFLFNNISLTEIKLEELRFADDYFLYKNNSLIKMDLPKLNKIGNSFLEKNNSLIDLNLPNVIEIGDNFLCENSKLEILNAPKLTKVELKFMENNKYLKNMIYNQVLNNNIEDNNIKIKKIHGFTMKK